MGWVCYLKLVFGYGRLREKDEINASEWKIAMNEHHIPKPTSNPLGLSRPICISVYPPLRTPKTVNKRTRMATHNNNKTPEICKNNAQNQHNQGRTKTRAGNYTK
jgi:hypothetical protein